jgi:hypothetical protein
MWSIGDLWRGVGVDRVRYDHSCSTQRNTSKLKTISRVPIPFVRHSQKQSRVGLKLIGPDEVAHNNVAEHRALNGEPGGDSVLGGAPDGAHPSGHRIPRSVVSTLADGVRHEPRSPRPTGFCQGLRRCCPQKRGNSARFPGESCTRIAAAVPRPSGQQAPRRVTRETLVDRGGLPTVCTLVCHF